MESLTKEETSILLKRLKFLFLLLMKHIAFLNGATDFRPEYRNLKNIIKQLVDLPIIGLPLRQPKSLDILEKFGYVRCHYFKASFNRPNLYYDNAIKNTNVDRTSSVL
jgi:ATP-dependent DNA helicase RecQ